MLRRWGRSSELQLFGSRRKDAWFVDEIDGVEYDSFFAFTHVGHNFEPSEIDAAFGLVQLTRLPGFILRRGEIAAAHSAFLSRWPEYFTLPRKLPELESAWLTFPFLVRREAPFSRGDLRLWLDQRGMAPRMVWAGNLLRHPGFRKVPHRAAPGGYPGGDEVMEQGLAILAGPGLSDEAMGLLHQAIADFVARY